MAANYEVNIQLNTENLKKQLDVIDKRVSNLGNGKGGKGQNSFAQQNNQVKSLLNFENKKLDLQIKNRSIRTALGKLDEQGVKTASLRNSLGKLATLQAEHTKKATIETYGFAKLQARQTQFDIKKQEEKTAELKRQTLEFRKQSREAQINAPKSPIGGTRYQMGSPAQLKYSGGPSSPIMGAPGIAGSPRGRVRGLRNPALQSAMISGAFPLLFGQSPVVAAAGALGGGLGQKFGGQQGGFAGGLVATAAVSSIISAVDAVKQLGQAMGPLEKNVTAMSAASGTAGTLRAKELQLMEQVLGKQAAYTAALEDMSDVIGDDGVKNLQQFGKDTQRLANEWSKFMLQLQAGFAWMFGGLLTETPEDRAKRIEDLIKEGKGAYDGGFFSEDTKALEELFAKRDEILATGNAVERVFGAKGTSYDRKSKEYQDVLAAIEEQIKILEGMDKYSDENSLKRQEDYYENLKRINELYTDIGKTIRDGMVDAIEGAIEGTKTLGEVASNVFRSIAKMMLQYGVTSALKSTEWKIFEGLHAGGTAKRNTPYIVGEKGPELFVPNKTGRVVPNDQITSGGTNVNVSVDATGSSVEGDGENARELGRMIGAAVQAELIRQKRPGGILTR